MKEVMIYGAGRYGKSLCNAIMEYEEQIFCFIDQYSSEKEFQGIKIYKVDQLNVDKNMEIYISIALNDVSSIKKLLYSHGFNNVFIFEDAIKKYPNFIKNIVKTNLLWMSEEKSELLNSDKIKEVESYLSDEASKNFLNKIVQFRKNLTYDTYLKPQIDQIQYFPDDIDLFSHIDRLKFIDCGAYIGDTIKTVIYNFEKVDLIVSIEPDIQNLKKLTNEIEKQKKQHKNIGFCVYPSGVWSENKILEFSSDGNSASSITNEMSNDSIKISVISLDDPLYGLAPNI